MLNRPLNADYVDWSIHFPAFFGIDKNNGDKIFTNSKLKD